MDWLAAWVRGKSLAVRAGHGIPDSVTSARQLQNPVKLGYWGLHSRPGFSTFPRIFAALLPRFQVIVGKRGPESGCWPGLGGCGWQRLRPSGLVKAVVWQGGVLYAMG